MRARPMRPSIVKFTSLAVLLCSAIAGPALAQGARTGGPTPSPAGATVYFVELENGATIAPKTVIHFGLRGMGAAPAGVERENAGHHHLLIDTELPPLDQPIPNDFNHLHFGNGQSEAEVSLPPGEHTLQLLLGDHNHVPHTPPVMSERIRVRVVEGAPGVAQVAPITPAAAAAPLPRRARSAPKAKVYFIYPTNGATVARKTTVRFGLVNMGVAPAGVERPNTGHHHLLIDTSLPPLDQPIPTDFNHLHFGAGQTEAEITLPLGTHTLRLLLADENHVPHDPPVYSAPIRITVTETGRPRTSRRRSFR